MIEFYLHKDNKNLGPFNKEELKENGITKDSFVWFKGQSDWLPAGEIEELKDLFETTTPPKSEELKIPQQEPGKEETNEKHFENEILIPPKKSKSTLILGIFLVASLIGNIWFFSSSGFNPTSTQNTHQVEELTQQINKLESEQQILKEKHKHKEQAFEKLKTQMLDEIDNSYKIANYCLQLEEEKLRDINSFQLLRSSSEKEAQINIQNERIQLVKNEIERLRNLINSFQ